jgi:hypothetical protein
MQSRRLWFEADPVVNGIKKPLHAAEVAFCLSERIFSPRGTGTVPAPSGQVTKPSLGLREIVRGDYTEAPIRNLPGSR